MSLLSRPFDLSLFRFSASIDYVTFATPGKRDLPPLRGKPRWGVAAHHKQLTVHDLRASDVLSLAATFPDAPVLDLEVAVDMKPERRFDETTRKALLNDAFVITAQHLYPYDAPHMADAKTVAFIPEARSVRPFNYSIPASTAQLLYGMRDDGDVQVKCYLKRRDDSRDLAWSRWVMRTEVKARQSVCQEFGITTLTDLLGFQFRNVLSPYFRMVCGPAPAVPTSERQVLKLIQGRLYWVQKAAAEESWSRTGVQGAMDIPGMRFDRYVDANQRTGQALQLLQRRFTPEDLVSISLTSGPTSPTPSGVCASTATRCVTSKDTYLPLPPSTSANGPAELIGSTPSPVEVVQ